MVAALLTCACSAYQTPVELVQAGVLDNACKIQDASLYSESGSIDLGYTDTYLLPIRWRSNLQPSTTTVNGEVIATANNAFTGTEIDYTYTLSTGSLPASMQQVSVVIAAGGKADANYFLAYPIRPENIDALRAAVPAGTTATLGVSVQVKGTMGSGGSATTNAFYFPIVVRNTTPLTCTAPDVLVGGSVCGNVGQDETPFCGTVTP
jgi:hypothetical protein